MLHTLRLAPAGRDYAITAGNETLVARTTAAAARELLDSGRAKPGDTARVLHPEHSPFVIDLARVAAYRPSQARLAVDRSGALHHHFGKEFAQARAALPSHA